MLSTEVPSILRWRVLEYEEELTRNVDHFQISHIGKSSKEIVYSKCETSVVLIINGSAHVRHRLFPLDVIGSTNPGCCAAIHADLSQYPTTVAAPASLT